MHLPKKKFEELWKIKPTAASDCVIINKNRILLIKRGIEPFKGLWCLPGGMMEVGETIEQTALREAHEETGYKTNIMSLVGVYSGPKRDPRGTTVDVVFLMKVLKKSGHHDKEVSEIKFFPTNKLPRNIGFDHRHIINDALKILNKKNID